MEDQFLKDLLDHACPMNVLHEGANYVLAEYYIETHCVGFTVTAYKSRTHDLWYVVSWITEDC